MWVQFDDEGAASTIVLDYFFRHNREMTFPLDVGGHFRTAGSGDHVSDV